MNELRTNMPFKVKPWDHQMEALKRAQDRENFGLFFEMGAGKTATAINILRMKYNKHKTVLPTLVICPPIVIENWRREFLAHSNLKEYQVKTLIGSGGKRLDLFSHSSKSSRERAKVFITNYEVFSVASMKPLYDALLEWGPKCIVFDESHRCKDFKAKRTKKAIEIADRAQFKYILTGTPVLNSLMDVFTQFRIMDGGKTFGKNFFSFRGKYFYDVNMGMPRSKHFPCWRPRRGALGEIREKIGASSMRVTKDECLDLPPLVKKTIQVPMTTQQQKLYDTMKKDFIAFINDKACVAELAITKALRLQQIVTGFVPVEEGQGKRINMKIKDNPRMQALKELLADLTVGNKVIVWCVFKENYNDIREVCEVLKVDYVECHGSVSQADKQKAVDKFNTDKKCKVFFGHPGSAGIGLNLVSASHSIFYSRSFSLEYDLQAEARNYRGGSEIHEKITRIDLVTPGTIDELVMKALASKEQLSYDVLKQKASEI